MAVQIGANVKPTEKFIHFGIKLRAEDMENFRKLKAEIEKRAGVKVANNAVVSYAFRVAIEKQ